MPRKPQNLKTFLKDHLGFRIVKAGILSRRGEAVLRVAGKSVRKYTLRLYSFLFKGIQGKCGKYSVNPLPTSENKALSGKSWYKIGHGKYPATRDFSLRARAGG
jgi:hypothetical protein